MKTYKKKRRSRNYKRKKYTRNYRNVRRSKRLMQKAGVFSSRSSRSSRVAPYPHTDSDPSLTNPINNTYYRTRMLNTLDVINSLDKIAANTNKMDKQPLELLSKLQENFHVYYTHMLNISNESVKELLMQELHNIKNTIEKIKENIENIEMSDLKSLCNTIEKEIHRINAIDLTT